MTNTEVDRTLWSLGNRHAETLELDISSLDSAGTETGVSPDTIDVVEGFFAHVQGGTGEVVSYDGTNNELEITDGSGAEVTGGSTINGVHVTWVGRR